MNWKHFTEGIGKGVLIRWLDMLYITVLLHGRMFLALFAMALSFYIGARLGG